MIWTEQRVHRGKKAGQTLIIALLVLGILLIVGFVFAGIISRNINQTSRARARTISSDLAEAGINYAQFQLQHSALGADWRPARTTLTLSPGGTTRDPDALYLRAGTNLRLASGTLDKGGPDGLGPYTRVPFDKGRALVRVRYAPADWDLTDNPIGALRQPGKARNYVVIESVGREGKINPNDPTLLNAPEIKVAGFANTAQVTDGLNQGKARDVALNVGSRSFIAFNTIGIVETAHFITNKFKSSVTAEIGSLTATASGDEGLGATYKGTPVQLTNIFGSFTADATGTKLIGSGSLYSNADVIWHGNQQYVLNKDLGDMIAVAGTVKPANSAAQLQVTVLSSAGNTTTTLAGAALDSKSAGFGTLSGVFRDGDQSADPRGFARSVPRKEPPSIMEVDPANNIYRYLTLSRDSGRIQFGGNTGRFGYGEGVYVNANANERGEAQDEDERIKTGSARSLMQDWLNPNRAATSRSGGWAGPFYVPLAASVRLLPNGFEIIRDARSGQPTWRRPNGQDTGSTYAKFRIVQTPGGPYVLNSVVSPDLVDQPSGNLTAGLIGRVTSEGFPFNGVVYFEGDVRVRGVIPTDVQMSVVSMGTIYIDGSITKGVVDENGNLLSRPSKSMCALMAKDYICVNTTQFFGPRAGELVSAKNASPDTNVPNAAEVVPTGLLRLESEFLLNPSTDLFVGSNELQPNTWRPYATTYREAGTNAAMSSRLLLTHAADAPGPSYMAMTVTPLVTGGGTPPHTRYAFPSYVNQFTLVPSTLNAGVRDLFGIAGYNSVNLPLYGLTSGGMTYPQFEQISLPLVDNTWTPAGGRTMSGSGLTLGLQQSTELGISLDAPTASATTNYELARVAVVPHDVRIEAILYAEEGSFFVIPGLPYNFDPNDTRAQFDADVASLGLAQAQQKRYSDHGSMPEVPFYGEPLNVRISILGSISENMPAPISVQAEWQRKWGWMTADLAGTGKKIPIQHVPLGYSITGGGPGVSNYVPNLIVNYDPALALATASKDPLDPIRTTPDGLWILPPAPRLPVSPQLAYFGEVNP